MWLVSISVMLAVVQWASSAGGSPRLPTRRIPPFFWASAVSVVAATSASDASASASSTARRDGFSVMRHLQIVGEPIYHTDGGRWARRRQRRPRRLLAGAAVSPRRASEPTMERAPERARILVPQEKCDLRDGELAVEQERGRHFTAELGEQG